MSLTLTLLTGFGISLVSVFFKGFQYQNIQGGHVKLAILSSYMMTACDVLFIGLVSQKGWLMFLPCATGAAIGIISSMYAHKRLIRKTP